MTVDTSKINPTPLQSCIMSGDMIPYKPNLWIALAPISFHQINCLSIIYLFLYMCVCACEEGHFG